jgi:hypothetical protein
MGEGDAFRGLLRRARDADGLTIVARPAGRVARARGGAVLEQVRQSTGVLIFDRVRRLGRVFRRRVAALGAPHLQPRRTTRHTCIAARRFRRPP